jgi:midasin (ATPase involved in ribosome maturation)
MAQINRISIDIPSNDKWVIENLIERFSKLYKIEIKIEKEEDKDGVVFFTISSNDFNSNIIFEIGYYYCGYVRQLREKGEIE